MRVVFDLYGTLVASQDGPESGAAWRRCVEESLGVPGELFAAAFSKSAPDREVGALSFPDAVIQAAQECGGVCSAGGAEEFFHASARLLVDHFDRTARAGLAEVLSGVRSAGVVVSLLSNASDDTAEALSLWGVTSLFDQVVVSSRVGYAKPDPEAYAAVGAGPGDVFVGDGGSRELLGARAVGMRALQISELHCDGSFSYRAGWDGDRAWDLWGALDLLEVR